MGFHNVLNNAASTLSVAVAPADLTINVVADVFPAVPFYLTLGANPATYEIVEVTAKAGLVFTIGRAKDGTTAKAYVVGDLVQLFMVAALLTEIKAEIDATNAAATTHLADNAKQVAFVPVPDATTSPTAAIVAGGSVDEGTHYYVVTFVTADGETGFTAISPTPTIAVTTAVNNTVNLSAIPLGPAGTTARKIYRLSSLQPGRYYVLLATINDNVTTVYSDTASDASLPTTGMQSRWNTTAGKIMIDSILAGYVGNSNTLLGIGGLENVTTGFDNTGVGMGVFTGMTTGYNNSAFGVNALYANTTGLNNTAIGVHALQNNLTGGGNVAIGVYSLQNNYAGYNNVAVGVGALQSNTSANSNTAIGTNSMLANTGGEDNVAIGEGSLRTNTIGDSNVGIGYNALHGNTSGGGNVAIGNNALLSSTTASSNTAVGSGSLQENTTGYNNVGHGYNALNHNTTGFNNTAIGVTSLLANVDGYNNTAFGLSALQSNTSGSNNVGMGVNSLLSVTTGTGNTGIGFSSGSVITTGTHNTFIGENSGQGASQGATVYRSTAIGYGAFTTVSDTMQLGDANLTNVGTHGDFEAQDIGDGFICKSDDGTRYKMRVANGGGSVVITAA